MASKPSQHPEIQQTSLDAGSVTDRLAAALSAVQPDVSAHTAGLPLPRLQAPIPAPSLYFATTPVDSRGRLADASPVRAVGWSPGQPITIIVIAGTIVVTSAPDGAESVTRQGHLRLPARIRHTCRLTRGDRLLVAAAPAADLLVAYTMPCLESILLQHHTSTRADEASR
jgi:bifunctional DNA-binding transcriptional regulator/antitoxin component of YhaV-PrlF toxin-antitoxin module